MTTLTPKRKDFTQIEDWLPQNKIGFPVEWYVIKNFEEQLRRDSFDAGRKLERDNFISIMVALRHLIDNREYAKVASLFDEITSSLHQSLTSSSIIPTNVRPLQTASEETLDVLLYFKDKDSSIPGKYNFALRGFVLDKDDGKDELIGWSHLPKKGL